MADGGKVHGKSHSKGGEKFDIHGRVVELEGDEGVINKRSMRSKKEYQVKGSPAKIASCINELEGGVKFEKGKCDITEMKDIDLFIKDVKEEIDSIGEAQEMSEAMGGEFAPPPSYSSVVSMIDESKFTIEDIVNHLKEKAKKEFIRDAETSPDERYPETKLKDMDESYTDSGNWAREIDMVYHQAKNEMKDGGKLKDWGSDKDVDALYELAISEPKKANDIWDKLSAKQRKEFKRKLDLTDAADEGIYKEFKYLISDANMKDGGLAPRSYGNMKPMGVWEAWNKEQKLHFLKDHFEEEERKDVERFIGYKYENLPTDIRVEVKRHVKTNRYKDGGKIPTEVAKRKFFEETSNELHYLYEKPVKEWDEYDESNWKSLNIKTGRIDNSGKTKRLSRKKKLEFLERYFTVRDATKEEHKRNTSKEERDRLEEKGWSSFIMIPIHDQIEDMVGFHKIFQSTKDKEQFAYNMYPLIKDEIDETELIPMKDGGKTTTPMKITKKQKFYHARFEDPAKYTKHSTPDWAERVADSVLEGSEVGMGKLKGSEKWEIQKIMIPVETGTPPKMITKTKAEFYALAILNKIKGHKECGGKVYKYGGRTYKDGGKASVKALKNFRRELKDMGYGKKGIYEIELFHDINNNRLSIEIDTEEENPLIWLIAENPEGDMVNIDITEEDDQLNIADELEKLPGIYYKDGGKTPKNNPISLEKIQDISRTLDDWEEGEYWKNLSDKDRIIELSSEAAIGRELTEKILRYRETGLDAEYIHLKIEEEYRSKNNSQKRPKVGEIIRLRDKNWEVRNISKDGITLAKEGEEKASLSLSLYKLGTEIQDNLNPSLTQVVDFLTGVKENFIEEAWKDNSDDLVSILKGQLDIYVDQSEKGYKSQEVMTKFIVYLNDDNRKILGNYIIKNH